MTLSETEVHVWQFPLDSSRSRVEELNSLLSHDEQARAVRFRHDQDRNRYIVAHGLLRSVLGGYLDSPPEELEFIQSSNGKPRLANVPSMQFNLSHSHNLALVAIARGREVGIDVEQIRDDHDFKSIAESFFTTAEETAIHETPNRDRCRMFFQLWTCKESVLKALGDGLSRSPRDVEVRLHTDNRTADIQIANGATGYGHWQVQTLRAHADYAAALTVTGIGWQLRYRECGHAEEKNRLHLSSG